MKFLKLTSILLFLQVGNLFSQTNELSEIEINNDGKISFSKPVVLTSANIGNEKAYLQKILQSNNQIEIKLVQTRKDEKSVHNFYQFFLHGIPIIGADYLVHSSNGYITFANGNVPILPNPIIDIPNLTFEKAKILLNAFLLADIKSGNKNVSYEYSDKGITWVFKDKILSLAYKIETKSNGRLLHGNYYVDAHTAKVLGFGSFICTFHNNPVPPSNAPGSGQTLYSGPQNFITDDNYNGGFRLREVRTGVNILTLNANFGTNKEQVVTAATDFFDNDNNWQTIEHSNDIQAHDVHWASEKVLDYFRIQHNRNSFDNNGLQIRSFVHVNTVDNSGQSVPMDNAYYYGGPFLASATHSMYYGDGNTIGNPFVSLDVVAHEMGHGIDEYTSQFIRDQLNEGEALGEGFSDIWAATIEHWVAPTKQNWLIGEEVMKNGFSCVRSLRSPKTEGFRFGFTSEGNYPDTYRKTNWDITNRNPHLNSTVLSHWYYLLVAGGSGTNDLGNNFSVNGIGFDKAANIVYKAQSVYLNLFADFPMVRTMTIQAVKDLYGINSCEEKEVTNAWYAVGIGASFTPTLPQANLSISGVQTNCSSTTCTLNNVPCGLNAIWTASPAGSVNFSCQNCNQTTATKITNGNVTITATINSNGVTQNTTSQIIHLGEYTSSDFVLSGNNGSIYWCPNQTVSFGVSGINPIGGAIGTNFSWSLPTGWTMNYNGGSYIVIKAPSSTYPPTGSLSVNFTEPCGTTLSISKFLAYSNSACSVNVPYTLSPNPASSYINIQVANPQTNIAAVQITDTYGNVLINNQYTGVYAGVQIGIYNLANGPKIAKIYSGTQWYSIQFIVQH